MSDTWKSALAIGAHPDDIEFMMAGTLILLKQAGWSVHYMNLCDGSCGSLKENAAAVAARRARESAEACRLLEAAHYPSLVPDLQLVHDTATLARVVSVVRSARPSILLLHSPSDYMEDHMNACRIRVTAAFARGMPNFPCDPPVDPTAQPVAVYHALPYGLRDALRRRISPGQYVDISSVTELKGKMLAYHDSQSEWLDESQWLDNPVTTMRKTDREVGAMSGRFEYAEGWRRHLHLGFSDSDEDTLSRALGERCFVDEEYEANLNGGYSHGLECHKEKRD